MARSPFQARPSGGDLSSPAEIGAAPKAPRVPPAPEADEPDGDEMPSTAPSPEALHYVDHPEPCSDCEHMNSGGQCVVLQMPVDPSGHCVAFEAKDGEDQEPDSDDKGMAV